MNLFFLFFLFFTGSVVAKKIPVWICKPADSLGPCWLKGFSVNVCRGTTLDQLYSVVKRDIVRQAEKSGKSIEGVFCLTGQLCGLRSVSLNSIKNFEILNKIVCVICKKQGNLHE